MRVEIRAYRKMTEDEEAGWVKIHGKSSLMRPPSVPYWRSDVGEEPTYAEVIHWVSTPFHNQNTGDSWSETSAIIMKDDGTFDTAMLTEIRAAKGSIYGD